MVSGAWLRIERWLDRHAPQGRSWLPAGVTDDQLADAERQIGLELPSAVRRSYQRHNGSNRLWVCPEGYLLPLVVPAAVPKKRWGLFRTAGDYAASLRDMRVRGYFEEGVARPKGPIRKEGWHDRWVPFTHNDCGDHLCLDLAPPRGGKKGQVIDWWHEGGPTRIAATSFAEWLAGVADRFEAGLVSYDPKRDSLVIARN